MRISPIENPSQPSVSVLMSVYSEPISWIKQSVDSILDQTFTDFEFIIVNDNPERPELGEFLKYMSSQDQRIKIHKNAINIGLTKSLNIGLDYCRGKYVARMDADDISISTRFERQFRYLESNDDCIVVGTYIKYFGPGSRFVFSDWIKSKNEDIKARMVFGSSFAHPTVMIRRSILIENNIKYDENYKYGQDYRLWEQLMQYGKYFNIPIKLLHYRLSAKQNKRINDGQSIEQRKGISKRILEKEIGPSLTEQICKEDKNIKQIKSVRDQIKNLDISQALYYEVVQDMYLFSPNIRLRDILRGWIFSDVIRFSSINILRLIYYKIRNMNW